MIKLCHLHTGEITTRWCHSHTFCTTICECGQNRSQESSIKKPASQRTSSVDEGFLGQWPTCYANITINTNIVDENLWYSLRERITCRKLVCRKLCYSQIKVKLKNLWVKGQVLFSAIVNGQGSFSID